MDDNLFMRNEIDFSYDQNQDHQNNYTNNHLNHHHHHHLNNMNTNINVNQHDSENEIAKTPPTVSNTINMNNQNQQMDINDVNNSVNAVVTTNNTVNVDVTNIEYKPNLNDVSVMSVGEQTQQTTLISSNGTTNTTGLIDTNVNNGVITTTTTTTTTTTATATPDPNNVMMTQQNLTPLIQANDIKVSASDVSVASNVSTDRKRSTISLETKLKVLKDVENGVKYDIIAKKYNLKGKSTISEIVRRRAKIENAFSTTISTKKKTLKTTAFADLEKALMEFINQCNISGYRLNQTILKQKALEIAQRLNLNEFKASDGFMSRFKQRNKLEFQNARAKVVLSSDEIIVKKWLEKLSKIIENYSPRNIYCANEFTLFYRTLPSKLYKLKGLKCKYGNQSRERLTIFLSTNMEGSDRLKLAVIGKWKKPICFKNVKQLPVFYYNNKKSWITSEIFTDIMNKYNLQFARENRNVLLFLNSTMIHSDIEFSNIKLIFLPTNTVKTVLQPTDAGIIRVLKGLYRNKVIKRQVLSLDKEFEASHATNISTNQQQQQNQSETKYQPFTVNVLDAIMMVKASWDELPALTIYNCFLKCGFKIKDNTNQNGNTNNVNMNQNLTNIATDTLRQLHIYNLIDEDIFNDYISFDDDVATSQYYNMSVQDGVNSSNKSIVDNCDNISDSDDDYENENELINNNNHNNNNNTSTTSTASNSNVSNTNQDAIKFYDVISYVDKLKSYTTQLNSSELTDELYKRLNELERHLFASKTDMQTKITYHFRNLIDT